MECSWIMVWLPTKQRERVFKTDSILRKRESSKKIQRLFSTEDPPSSNLEHNEDQNVDKKDRKENQTTQKNAEENSRFNLEKVLSDISSVPVPQNCDSNKEKECSTNSSSEKFKAGSRVSNTSTRFQVQRQNTEVLTKEEKKEEPQENDSEEEEDEVFREAESYTQRIEKILLDLDVNATSLKTKDDAHILVTFCLENSKVEDVLLLLQENGIGNSPSETSISVIPASVHFEVPLVDDLNPR